MIALSSLSRLNIAFGVVIFGLITSIIGIMTNIKLLDWIGIFISLIAALSAFFAYKKLKESLNIIYKVCEAASLGDLEKRVILINDSGQIAKIAKSVNHVLDMSDAFVRESKASFDAVEKGNFNRRIIERGIVGSYDIVAKSVNNAIIAMDKRFSDFSSLILSAEETTQRVLGHVVDASTKLKSDSSEMINASNCAESGVSNIGFSASETTEDAHVVANNASELSAASSEIEVQLNQSRSLNKNAEEMIQKTRDAMNSLTLAMREIGPIVEIIQKIAAQTRLLALNASIEAVRAGEAGIAFAVVAAEVKTLSDQTAHASDDISKRIELIDESASRAQSTIENFVSTVVELTAISEEISAAVSYQIISSNSISEAIRNTANRSDEVKNQVTNVLSSIKQTSNQAQSLSQTAYHLDSEANNLNDEMIKFLDSARKIVGA